MAEVEENLQNNGTAADGETQEPAKGDAAAEGSTDEYEVGDPVVIREDFHSKYFQGLRGAIAGPARKGGVSAPLWPVKINVPPHEIVIMGKYLRRP